LNYKPYVKITNREDTVLPTVSILHRVEESIVTKIEQLPIISVYAKTRGWPYVISWLHRITGILLVIYALFHIYTLSLLQTPQAYDAKMTVLGSFIFILLEWALAVPVVFHALNGGRLVLYEIFGARNDTSLISWTWSLTVIYALLLGLMMVLGNQTVTPGFFWLTSLVVACSLGYAVAAKIWKSGLSMGWKLQRITGSLLIIMIPAHMLFMHLNMDTAHGAKAVIERMQSPFVKAVDLGLVFAVLFHGSYGILSIVKDYVSSNILRKICALLIYALTIVVALAGIRLTVFI